MSQAVKRFLAFFSGSLAALLVLALTLWWWAAPSLVTWVIDGALRGAGLPPFAFRIDALSWGRLQLHEIHLDSGELAAQRIDLDWSWDDLLARRVDSASLHGLAVRARSGERGFSLGALDPWLAELTGSDSRGGGAPLRRLVVEAGSLSIDTPAGPVQARIDADLVLRPQVSGHIALDWQLSDATPGSARAQIDASGAIQARAELAADRAFVAQLDPELAQRWPHRVQVKLEGTGAQTPDAIDFELALDAQLADAAGSDQLRRANGPIRVRWQQDALLVSLLPCMALSLPAGALVPGFALERAGAICIESDAAEPIRVSIDGETARLRGGKLVAKSSDLSVRFGARDRRVRGRGVVLHVSADPDADGSRGALRLTGDRFDVLDAGIALRAPVVQGEWRRAADPVLAGRFELGQLIDAAARPRFPPLRGTGKLELDARQVRFDARARDETGSLAAQVRGEHKLSSGVGRAQLRFDPLSFGAQKATMRVVEPWIGEALRIDGGAIGIDAVLRWGEAGLATTAQIESDDALVVASRNRIEGLAGAVALTEVFPPATRGVQELRFRRADAGIPLGSGQIRYAIDAGHLLRIERAEIEFAGGHVEVRGGLDLDGGPAQRLEFQFVDLQAPALLALAPVEGLEVSGKLGGQLTLAVEAGRPVLRGGLIRAIEGGRIRYRPSEGSGAPAAPTDVSGMLRDALRDFRYEVLDVTATGWLDERADVQCKLRGTNPSFQGGRPVHLTINISSAFAEVIRAMPAIDSFFARLAEPTHPSSPPNGGRTPGKGH